jgi:hypothetical protein
MFTNVIDADTRHDKSPGFHVCWYAADQLVDHGSNHSLVCTLSLLLEQKTYRPCTPIASALTECVSARNRIWTDMGWVSVGVKWACCAVCGALYLWTIFAPLVFPDRDFGF